MSLLLHLPQEILDNIAFFLSCPSLNGLPIPLTPLLLTCNSLYRSLKLPEASRPSDHRNDNLRDGNPALYARIFRFKFSSHAIVRRSFTPTATECTDLLVRYLGVLREVKSTTSKMVSLSVRPDDPDVENMLSAILIMLLEDDGCNSSQLNAVGAYECVLGLLMGKGLHQPFLRGGWPDDSLPNTCALWILWLLTSTERIRAETDDFCEQFIDRLFPFVSAPFRYNTTYAPPNHFHLPLTTAQFTSSQFQASSLHALSIPTHHGPYPVYHPSKLSLNEVQAGRRIVLSYPPISIAAKLLVISRRQVRTPIGIPPHLPLTRAEANQRNYVGPTQEDIHEWNAGGITLPGDIPPNSNDWDSDWARMRACGNAWMPAGERRGRVHQPGTLKGLWSGRRLIPSELAFNNLLASPPTPDNAPTETNLEIAVAPMYMRLEEHVSFIAEDDSNVLPCGGPRPTTSNQPLPSAMDALSEADQRRMYDAEFDQGLKESWYPQASTCKSTWEGDGIEVTHPFSNGKCVYTTLGKERIGEKGRWHDKDTCPGCLRREEMLAKARRADSHSPSDEQSESSASTDVEMSEADDDESDDEDLYSQDERAAYDPKNILECDGVADVLITGDTDPRHILAWQEHYTFRGRIRPWDGTLSILKVPQNPDKGPIILYGNIIGSRNFVGNWRMTVHDVHAPAWEGAVVMGRRD